MINKVKEKSNDHIEEWGEVTNKIQSFYHWVGKNYFTNHIDIYRIVVGKVGLTASLAVLMAKHKAGEDTVSDWLAAGSDISMLLAGYTGNHSCLTESKYSYRIIICFDLKNQKRCVNPQDSYGRFLGGRQYG